MPATHCDDTQPFAFTTNGECDFFVAWTWDGTTTPPTCNGTVQSISWANRSQASTYYAHIEGTRNGPVCVVIPPVGEVGSSGSEAQKQRLRAAGLQTLDDIRNGLRVSTDPPQAGETVIQAAAV